MRSQLLPDARGAARPCCALYRWLVVGLIFLVVLILFVQRINVSVAIIPWATECGWDEAQQQSLLGAFFWGYLVTMFPGALLSNRFTAHHEGLAVVLVLSCALCAATPLAGCNTQLAAAARVGVGMAQGPLFPLVSGLFGQWVRPNEYSRANAFVCEGSNLGVLVAFPVTSLICRFGGWRSAFFIPAAAGVPCLLLLLVFGSSTPGSNRWVSAEEKAVLRAARRSAVAEDDVVSVRWGCMLTHPVVWVMTLNWFGLNWCSWVLLTELPKYLHQALGFDLTASGFISDLPPIANAIGSLVFALIADALITSRSLSVHNTRRLMNGGGALVQGLCLALIPTTDSTPLIIILLAASQGASGATNSGVFSNIFDIAPRTCGALCGFVNCVGMSQGVISPALTALILSRGIGSSGSSDSMSGSGGGDGGAGAWTDVWVVAAVLALLSAVSFQLLSTGDVIEDAWIVEDDRPPRAAAPDERARPHANGVEKREPDDDGKDDSGAGGGGALFDRATQRRLSMTRSFTQLRADVAASEQQPSATATGSLNADYGPGMQGYVRRCYAESDDKLQCATFLPNPVQQGGVELEWCCRTVG